MKITEASSTRFVLTKDNRLIAGILLVVCIGWIVLVPFGVADQLGFDTDPLPTYWASLGIGVFLLLAAVAAWFIKSVLILDTAADVVQLRRVFFGRRKVVGFPFSQLRKVALDEVENSLPDSEGPKQKWARCLFVPKPDNGHQRFELSASAGAASKFRAVRDWAHRIKGIPLER